MTNYTVQLNDNLTKIAKAHNTTVQELVRLNNITDSNLIYVNQSLKLPETLSNTAQADNSMMDEVIFSHNIATENTAKNKNQTQTPKAEKSNESLLPYAAAGIAGGVTVLAGQKLAPYVKNGTVNIGKGAKSASETAKLRYMYGKDSAKKNAAAVGKFISQKIKHAQKAVELNYAFAKDVVKTKAGAAKSTTKSNVSKAVETTKQAAQKGLHKAKVRGRYARLVANTKVAPKILKGAGRLGTPVMVAIGVIDVGTKLRKGDKKGAVKEGAALAAGWAGAKIGAAAGSFAGPIGSVVGGVIGCAVGYFGAKKYIKF